MNFARYVWGSIAVFVYIFFIEWIFHGLIMKAAYSEHMELLRPESEATAYFIWMLLGFLILAFGFCFIFVKGYEGKGCAEGMRFGFYVALAFSVPTSLINYAVFPLPGNWIIAWLIGYPIIFMFAGAIIATIYKPKSMYDITDPNGNRTRVYAVKGRRPGPLDDGVMGDLRDSISFPVRLSRNIATICAASAIADRPLEIYRPQLFELTQLSADGILRPCSPDLESSYSLPFLQRYL